MEGEVEDKAETVVASPDLAPLEALPSESDADAEPPAVSCVECGNGQGELLKCSNCTLAYHRKCLLAAFQSQSDTNNWQCPQCHWKLISEGATQTEGEPALDEEKVKKTETGATKLLAPNLSTDTLPEPDKKRKKPATEGSNYSTKINVGYSHQVPFTPAFFLDDGFDQPAEQQEWARLMYSPYQLERIRNRKIQEGCTDSMIKNEYELAEFIQACAKNWKNCPGWHPFSPEFAYKILHFADYDPQKALKIMGDPNFNFACVCDPPTRRYDNKWKPKDRRGQASTSPYPPPVTLRGYLLRRHNNLS